MKIRRHRWHYSLRIGQIHFVRSPQPQNNKLVYVYWYFIFVKLPVILVSLLQITHIIQIFLSVNRLIIYPTRHEPSIHIEVENNIYFLHSTTKCFWVIIKNLLIKWHFVRKFFLSFSLRAWKLNCTFMSFRSSTGAVRLPVRQRYYWWIHLRHSENSTWIGIFFFHTVFLT